MIYNLPFTIYLIVETQDLGTAIVEQEDFIVGLTLLAHDGGTYLTETYTVAPTTTVEAETFRELLNLEG